MRLLLHRLKWRFINDPFESMSSLLALILLASITAASVMLVIDLFISLTN